jgi:hypothetical protein
MTSDLVALAALCLSLLMRAAHRQGMLRAIGDPYGEVRV